MFSFSNNIYWPQQFYSKYEFGVTMSDKIILSKYYDKCRFELDETDILLSKAQTVVLHYVHS